jgi:hypothetical protein
LDEHTQSPKPERGFAVFFYNIKMRVIDAATHLSDLLNHSVDTLRKWVIESTEGCL